MGNRIFQFCVISIVVSVTTYNCESIPSEVNSSKDSFLPILNLTVGSSINPDNIRENMDVYFECKIHANPWVDKVVWLHNVYVFDSSAQDDSCYWRDDGKSWLCCKTQQQPWRQPIKLVTQRVSRLLHDGNPVHCYRTETWMLNGNSKAPSTWEPARVLVPYHGSFDVESGVNANHGNAGKRKAAQEIFHPDVKRGKKSVVGPAFEGFVRTPQATLRAIDDLLKTGSKPSEIQRVLNNKEVYDEDGDFEGPRNKKQIQNRAHVQNTPSVVFSNDIADVYAFAIKHRDIIRRMELIPGLLVITRHPALEAHFADLYKVSNYLHLYYDTTFNVGQRFASILAIRHSGLKGNPVYPLHLLYHEYTDKKSTYDPFFETVSKDLVKLNSKKTVIVTDRELSIKSAIAEKLPNSIVDRWTSLKKYNREDRVKYHFAIKSLLWSNSVEEYDQTLGKFGFVTEKTHDDDEDVDDAGNVILIEETVDTEITDEEELVVKEVRFKWDQRFCSYYNKYLDVDIRKSCRSAVAKYGIFNLYSGVTTNPGESMNSVLQSSIAELKQPTLYSLINDVYDFQTSQLLEIKKGLWENKGNNVMNVDFKNKRDQLPIIEMEKSRISRPNPTRELTNSNLTWRMDKDVNYSCKRSDANDIVTKQDVVFVREGMWMVKDKFDEFYLVDFPAQSCRCPLETRCEHILAVNIASGVEGNSNFDNLNYVKPTTITRIYKKQANKKVGKKRGGNRVPVVYDVSGVQEEMQEEQWTGTMEPSSTEFKDESKIPPAHVSNNVGKQREAKRLKVPSEGPRKSKLAATTFKPQIPIVTVDPPRSYGTAIMDKSSILNSLNFIPWGGCINIKGKPLKVTNTCSFDNLMFMLYAMSRMEPGVHNFFITEVTRREPVARLVHQTLSQLGVNNITSAKTVFATKLTNDYPQRPTRKHPHISGDFYFGEDVFVKRLQQLFPLEQLHGCSNVSCNAPKTQISYLGTDVILRNPNTLPRLLNHGKFAVCDGCGQKDIKITYSFPGNEAPPMLLYCLPLIDNMSRNPSYESNIRITQTILGLNYRTFGYTLNTGDHYISVVVCGNKRYLYDGLNSTIVPYKPRNEEQGVVVHYNTSAGIIIANQSLVLQLLKRSSAGIYICKGSNIEGETSSNAVELNIMYKPVCKMDQKRVYGVAKGEQVEIECKVDSNPKADYFKWAFNNSVESIDVPQANFSNANWVKLTTSSIFRYTPYSDLDYGSVICVANNKVGHQCDPCVFHVIAPGKPDPPVNCTARNITSESLQIECAEGFEGGLPQVFHAEVVDAGSHRLLLNLTSPIPMFVINGLRPGQNLKLYIYSSNQKGISDKIALEEQTIQEAEKVAAASHADFELIRVLGVCVGIVCCLVGSEFFWF